MKSIRVEVTEEQHRLLKSVLAYKNMSIAEWVRMQIDKMLEDKA